MKRMKNDNSDAIVARVLARYKQDSTIRTGMARATIVIDENVSFLESALKEANFHTVVPKKGISDFDIKNDLLTHRIFVTKNTQDFLDDAPVFDYGIIGLEALRFIDSSSSYKKNKTVQMISKAISKHGLISKRTGFVLMLKPNGKHVFKNLE